MKVNRFFSYVFTECCLIEACALQSTQSCLSWNGEPEATAGKPQIAADVEFYLDIDEGTGVEMVHVADPKPQRRQPEFLVRDIARQCFLAYFE